MRETEVWNGETNELLTCLRVKASLVQLSLDLEDNPLSRLTWAGYGVIVSVEMPTGC